MKCLAYLRVSTDGQVGEDKFGLSVQEEAIEQYASKQGYQIISWYSDSGISGANIDRPGLLQLISDSSIKDIKGVIVAKIDRIARDLMSQLWIEKELMKNEVELISVSEPFRGQDPANILFRQIIGAFAQFEKSRITERMAGGRRAKAKQGGYAGGCPPIGYKAHRGSKILYVDDEKAATVQRVFQIKNNKPDISLQKIADILNDEGYTTARGSSFKKMQIKRILDRETTYTGLYKYSGLEAPSKHSAILK